MRVGRAAGRVGTGGSEVRRRAGGGAVGIGEGTAGGADSTEERATRDGLQGVSTVLGGRVGCKRGRCGGGRLGLW